MVNQKRGIVALALLTVMLVSMSAFAAALGVSLGPSRDNPLMVSPGETVNVPVNIQNALGKEDVTVSLSISQGKEIATTSAAGYILKAGSSDTYANVKIRVPDTAEIGTEYLVTLSLATVAADDSGQMVGLGSAIDVTFPVKVVEAKPEATSEKPARLSNSTLIFLSVVIILILLWIISKLGKKRK